MIKPFEKPQADMLQFKVPPRSLGMCLGPVLTSVQHLVISEAKALWQVKLSGCEGLLAKDAPGVAPWPRDMFDVRLSHAHSSATAARLILRLDDLGSRVPAIKEAMGDGFFFSLMTGLNQTKNIAGRELRKSALVAVMLHRMILHIGTSQEWNVLAPLFEPPRNLLEQGINRLEGAKYGAYYAFLKPLRLPFVDLRPIMPIACVAWGTRARDALLSLPYLLEPESNAKQLSDSDAYRRTQLQSQTVRASNQRSSNRIATFIDVALEHITAIQIVDTVKLDVLTGMVRLLLYSNILSSSTNPDVWIILLDAARGMQAIASPLCVSELRRSSL